MRLVLLHGVPTSSRLWSGVRSRLPCDSLAPDLPGFGGTPGLSAHSPDDYADAILPELLDGDHLVGHDFGGLVAAACAVRRPFASLTLVSTALGPGWWPARLGALPVANVVCYRMFGGRRWCADHPDAIQFLGPEMTERMIAVARAIRPVRPAIRARCLWGRDDRHVAPWMGRRLAASLGAPFHLLPGGHFGMVTHPSDWATGLVELK